MVILPHFPPMVHYEAGIEEEGAEDFKEVIGVAVPGAEEDEPNSLQIDQITTNPRRPL